MTVMTRFRLYDLRHKIGVNGRKSVKIILQLIKMGFEPTTIVPKTIVLTSALFNRWNLLHHCPLTNLGKRLERKLIKVLSVLANCRLELNQLHISYKEIALPFELRSNLLSHCPSLKLRKSGRKLIKVFSNTCSTIELSPHYSGTEGFEPSTTAFNSALRSNLLSRCPDKLIRIFNVRLIDCKKRNLS